MLSDVEIHEAIEKGEIKISGVDSIHIGPSSVDLHLDNKAKVMHSGGKAIDLRDPKYDTLFSNYDGWESIAIAPGAFYLLSTKERITLADDIGGFVQGRSSIGRVGINVHCAGYVDVGFSGTITLEVTNFTNSTIIIPADTRICQIVFMRSGKPAVVPYRIKQDAKYQNQSGPTSTKVAEDYKQYED